MLLVELWRAGEESEAVVSDFETTFTLHPLDGSSRFGLLGLLAVLYGLVSLEPDPKRNK